ncbi:MAG: carboxypeptidase regulatory-like domain-containing protein [Planctomycetota bacterium]
MTWVRERAEIPARSAASAAERASARGRLRAARALVRAHDAAPKPVELCSEEDPRGITPAGDDEDVGTLVIRVLMPNGRPATGAFGDLHGYIGGRCGGNSYYFDTQADRSGQLVFDGLPTHLSYELFLSSPKAARTALVVPKLYTGDRVDLGVIQLREPAAIQGVVKTSDGRLVAEVTIDASSHVAIAFDDGTAETDAAGEFRIDDLPFGEYSLEVRGGGVPTVRLPDFYLDPGQTHELEIIVPAANSFCGRVVSAAGAGMDGATVTASAGLEREAIATTDRHGNFEFVGLTSEYKELTARHGFLISSISADSLDDLPAVIALPAPGEVQIEVRSATNGVPLSATVSRNDQPIAVVPSSGALRLTAMRPGEYSLGIESEGYEPQERVVRISADTMLKASFALEPQLPRELRVRVLDGNGHPIANAEIQVIERRVARTGVDGVATVSIPIYADSDVTVSAPGFVTEEVDFEFGASSRRTSVDVRLRPAARLEVTIEGMDTTDSQQDLVVLLNGDYADLRREMLFVTHSLPTGPAGISVFERRSPFQIFQVVELVEGEVTRVSVLLPPSFDVEIHVLLDGKAVKGGALSMCEWTEGFEAISYFELEEREPGLYIQPLRCTGEYIFRFSHRHLNSTQELKQTIAGAEVIELNFESR